jgi:acetoin utilization deacetylase AcuC-like enzyme
MKVIYTERHKEHAPVWEFAQGAYRPYPEVPERVERIRQALEAVDWSEVVEPDPYPLDAIETVHDRDYLRFLEEAYSAWEEAFGASDKGLVPDTFVVRGQGRRPDDLLHQAGYYCFETQTPIVGGTYSAALGSAWCALTGADLLLGGERSAYALCRPPGHHASRNLYGGFCYLNNAALAAARLAGGGRVAVLDVDYHHGNGTQDIFYGTEAVLFVSIHADTNHEYPFFSGSAEETGEDAGLGYTRNYPLEQGVEEGPYLEVLDRALADVRVYRPAYLVVSLGVDTLEEDPLGKFALTRESLRTVGERIEGLGIPTLLVQEGGYSLDGIGESVVNALEAFAE